MWQPSDEGEFRQEKTCHLPAAATWFFLAGVARPLLAAPVTAMEHDSSFQGYKKWLKLCIFASENQKKSRAQMVTKTWLEEPEDEIIVFSFVFLYFFPVLLAEKWDLAFNQN